METQINHGQVLPPKETTVMKAYKDIDRILHECSEVEQWLKLNTSLLMVSKKLQESFGNLYEAKEIMECNINKIFLVGGENNEL